MDSFIDSLVTTAVSAGISCSFIFILALWRRSWSIAKLGLGVFSLFLLDGIAVHLPRLIGLDGIYWAVSGKFLQLLVFFLAARELFRVQVQRPRGEKWWMWVPIITVLTLLPSFLLQEGLLTKPLGLEWGLYQATLPGLAEEIIYRGIILTMLDQSLGRSIKLFGVRWGLGVVITTLQFYFAHCFTLTPEFSIQIQWSALPDFVLYGVCMCWLHYRFESVWPSILTHNLHNLILVSLPLLTTQEL